VGVEESDSFSIHEILADEGFEESGFAGAGLPNHVEVVAAILTSDTKGLWAGTEIGAGEESKIFGHLPIFPFSTQA
jgi:hypothetical protein